MTGQPAFPQRTDPDLIRAEDTTFENERSAHAKDAQAVKQLLDALSIPGASSGYEEDHLAAERGRQEELARKVGFLETVLDGITQKAEQALHSPASGKVHSLYDILESANAALQRPKVGTRVKRLVPPRGDQGTVIGWNAELHAPLIQWDSERGLPPEACEPHEYTTDLNEEAQR